MDCLKCQLLSCLLRIGVCLWVCSMVSWLMWLRGQEESGFDSLQKNKGMHPSLPQQTTPAWTTINNSRNPTYLLSHSWVSLCCPHLRFPGLPKDFRRIRSDVREESQIPPPSEPDQKREFQATGGTGEKSHCRCICFHPAWLLRRLPPLCSASCEEIKCFKAFPPLLIFNASARLKLAHWKKK